MATEVYHSVINDIVSILIDKHVKNDQFNINIIIKDVLRKYKYENQPRLIDIISNIPKKYKGLIHKLRLKPIRTASGVSIIAVMCKPHRCPHIYHTGNICIYCPGGPDSSFEYSTQSYTGYEPTSMRAIRARYNPFLQSKNRLLQLKALGHNIDKIEFIVMGGTFLSLNKAYKEEFIKDLHDSLSGKRSANLREALAYSEQSKIKCIGITIETRPDYCFKPHISEMLVYGCTRVEIGVQSIFEFIARDTNRGHTVESVKHSFSLCKDSGYKVVTHMMPNLPGITKSVDLLQFQEFFRCPSFRPDGLKIYPTLVIKDTGLYELWKNKLYKSYSPDELVDLLAKILMMVPPWTRVYRVQRDIPMPLVSSGVEYGNIRELAMQKIKDYNGTCRDIRSREVGIKRISESIKVDDNDALLIRRDYIANYGWETFLSFESVKDDVLIGMLRLRKAGCDTFREELQNSDKMYDCDLNVRKQSVDHVQIFENQNKSGLDTQMKDMTISNMFENQNKSGLDSQMKDMTISNMFENQNKSGLDSQIKDMTISNMFENQNKSSLDTQMKDMSVSNLKSDQNSQNIHKNWRDLLKNAPPLDITKNTAHPEIINENASIIRELHVYGDALTVSKTDDNFYQHKGYGKKLIEYAENIAKNEHKSKKLAIISGIGTRNYYKKFGYELDGVYMSKFLL